MSGNDRRLFTGDPILGDDQANLLWVDCGLNCLQGMEEGKELNPEESCLAVGFSMQGEINNGGVQQWFFNTGGPQLFRDAVPALHRMGAVGMAKHIERTLAACLGPREQWKDVENGQNWDEFLHQRLNAVDGLLGLSADGACCPVALSDLGMTGEEWGAFIEAHTRKVAEMGDATAFRAWFDPLAKLWFDKGSWRNIFRGGWRNVFGRIPRSHEWVINNRAKNNLRADGSAPVNSLWVAMDEESGVFCSALHDPSHAGDAGYHYWENEFLVKGYTFTLEHISRIRPEFRPKQ